MTVAPEAHQPTMSPKKLRVTATFAILGFWLLMMGLLVRRELGTGVDWSPGSPTSGDVASRDVWLGIFLPSDERVGHVRFRQSPEQRHAMAGTLMQTEARARLTLLGRETDLDLNGRIWRPLTGSRAELEFTVQSADYEIRVTGALAEGRLRAEVFSAGESFPLEMPIDEDLVFSSGLGTALEFPALDVGEEVRLASFDPLTLGKTTLRVRCVARENLVIAGEEVTTSRMDVTSGGLSSQVWVDENGEVLQAQVPLGLTLRRLGPEETAITPSGNDGGELLDVTAVRPRGVRPFRGARSVLLKITAPAGRPLPENRLQRAVGEDLYRLTTPDAPPAGLDLPHDGSEEFLRADPFIQSDHPRIRRAASDIVGDESDPWQRALEIHRFVYEALEKEPVASLPSALEILDKRRGDCNEHTVLFTALARASDLPTRIAIGLVWSDELDGFYYHAWPEVRVGDWIAMDPTLDQPIADATHVKLLNGGIEKWMELVAYLGQLEIEVVEIE